MGCEMVFPHPCTSTKKTPEIFGSQSVAMNNQELYKLFKNSKLAQVATPLSKRIRAPSTLAPTHQIVYTPRAHAAISDYGLKTALPKQIGRSHIAINDIDNYKNMPDVEKQSGPLYTRLKFQESGVVLKKLYSKQNPLFPYELSRTLNASKQNMADSVLSKFNLGQDVSVDEVRLLLKKNPTLHKQFKLWLVEHYPESVLLKVPSRIDQALKEFIASNQTLVKREASITDFSRKHGVSPANAPMSSVQGTAGLSYLQKGRLANTPNGIKHGVIAPGRLVREREAAIGGFVAAVNERTTLLQANYAKNAPGKHSRQFVIPFKVNEAELTPSGAVRMQADGVKVGNWMLRTDSGYYSNNYVASNPNFDNMSERNRKDASALESLLGLVSKSRN